MIAVLVVVIIAGAFVSSCLENARNKKTHDKADHIRHDDDYQ